MKTVLSITLRIQGSQNKSVLKLNVFVMICLLDLKVLETNYLQDIILEKTL